MRKIRGFTMIELLIVIAVLGVLAVAVLSAINPIEQINRGRDTGSRSDAEQLLSAFDRYYTTHQIYPWEDPEESPRRADVEWQKVDKDWMNNDGENTVLGLLSTGGTAELKASFVDRLDKLPEDYKLYVHFSGNEDESVYVCFKARSGSFKKEALDRCDAGLPSDLRAVKDTICAEDSPYVCLP